MKIGSGTSDDWDDAMIVRDHDRLGPRGNVGSNRRPSQVRTIQSLIDPPGRSFYSPAKSGTPVPPGPQTEESP